MSLDNLVYNKPATSYQMGGIRAFLGSLKALLSSDRGLHGTSIPAFLSIYVNALKTSLSISVEFFEHSHLAYVSTLKHKTIQT